MTLTDTAFAALADATLTRLERMVETLDEEGVVEVELLSGVLSIELPSGRQFVINKHASSQQIWLSSPLSGGLHFTYDDVQQVWGLADGRRLDTLLKAEIETLLADEE